MRHRPRRVAQLLVFVWFLLIPALTLAGEPVVILLSLDGVRHDYPDRSSLPAFERMEREGVRAARLEPVFPTNTFPNHVTLATGAHVDRHGIVGNSFRDRERGRFYYSDDASWIEAEPVWVSAERQGVPTATFFWVGSETDWRGVGPSYRRAPFDGRISERQKVGQILDWLDLPEPQRPRLILSWWHGSDAVGHRFGPDHREVTAQLAAQDGELARLIAGLDRRDAWTHTTLVVVSDHGMAATTKFLDVLGPLHAAGIRATLTSGGGMAYVQLEEPAKREDALRVVDGIEHLRVYPSDALPERFRARRPLRTGDLTVLTSPPYSFSRSPLRGRILAFLGLGVRGTHGFAPDELDMAGVFYALGRSVRSGIKLGVVRAVDVAPTVTALLGINPPLHSEGEVISGLLSSD